jgi:hypothetical protein
MNALLLMALVAALADHEPAPAVPRVSEPVDLMSVLRASDFAEIYIVSPELRTVTQIRPIGVRTLGCIYVVRRESPDWDELQRVLEQAAIEIRPATYIGEVRLGLILGDERGTILEIYANSLQSTALGMNGFTQRRIVEISASFVSTLRGFAERHPELALPDPGPMRRCPREARR